MSLKHSRYQDWAVVNPDGTKSRVKPLREIRVGDPLDDDGFDPSPRGINDPKTVPANVRLAESFYRAAEELLHDPRTPFKTMSDLYRDLLYRGLDEWRRGLERPSPALRDQATAGRVEGKATWSQQQYERIVRNVHCIGDTLAQYLAVGDHAEVRRELVRYWDDITSLDSAFWQANYVESLRNAPMIQLTLDLLEALGYPLPADLIRAVKV
jgi:hypothetical protein